MNNMDINTRQNQLTSLENYLKNVDTEVTMILQNLQWDRRHLGKRNTMVACQYNSSHRVPPDKLEGHENGCFLKSQGYTEEDRLLPSPIDPDATTVVKLSEDSIVEIINNASQYQPTIANFNTGSGCGGHQPLTLERLQERYTADERRAIHDAVVNEVPSCHDLSDLALLSSTGDVGKKSKAKSKLEILAELRDMRRRRTKYRVAAKTRNYSDVLRDVITTQMELYTQAHSSISQIFAKSNNLECNSKAEDTGPKGKDTTRYCDNTPNKSCHSEKGQTSNLTNEMYTVSRYSRYDEEYDIRKRRRNDVDHLNISTRYSKTLENGESASSKTNQYKTHMLYDSQSNRREDDKDTAKANRQHKHYDQYGSRSRHEKKYNRKGKDKSKEYSLNTAKDKSSHNRNDYGILKDKYHSNKRYYSRRVRDGNDYYGNKKLSPMRYEYKQKEEQRERIKNEKGDNYDSDTNSSEASDTKYSDVTAHYCETQNSSVIKVKAEEEVYVKKEENSVRDDFLKKYGSKSIDTFNKYKDSRVLYGKHSNSTTYKDKHKYYNKNNDSTNYNNNQQWEHKEAVFEEFKKEKGVLYNELTYTNEGSLETEITGNWHRKNRNERHRIIDDKCRKEKKRHKEKTYRKH